MKLGLIGKSLQHSFSREYFSRKFETPGLGQHAYSNFELADISEFPELLKKNPGLRGLNVTIPYKTEVIPYLDTLSPEAREIGAVNTILFEDGEAKGYNTDAYGFEHSLKPLLRPHHDKALILGTGGASRAVAYVLSGLNLHYKKVSRNPAEGEFSYREASLKLGEYPLVINTTPLGTIPDINNIPPLELDKVSENHLFYDLVYNPAQTRLLKEAGEKGVKTKNGYDMLVLQAERAWEIWNEF